MLIDYIFIPEGNTKTMGEQKNEDRISAQYTLYNTYLDILKMASPFIPHITEEMYHADYTQTGNNIFQGYIESKEDKGYFFKNTREKSIHNTLWPNFEKNEINKDIKAGSELMLDVISKVRKHKSENKMKLKDPLPKIAIKCDDEKKISLLKPFIDDVIFLSKTEEITFIKEADKKEDVYDLKIEL